MKTTLTPNKPEAVAYPPRHGVLPAFLFAAFLFVACSGESKDTDGDVVAESATDSIVITFSSTIPSDVPDGAQQPAWAIFMWENFIALNWPALDPVTSKKRGVADNAKSFYSADPGALLVWETWKEKEEIFPPSPMFSNINPTPFDSLSPWLPGGYPACNNSLAALGQLRHTFTQIGKAPTGFPQDVLDETTELGVATVWYTKDTVDSNRLRYEVKVNRDEYNYILAQQLYDSSIAAAKLAYTTAYLNGSKTYKVDSVINLPRGVYGTDSIGSIETKSTWRPARWSGPNKDDLSKFHHALAYDFYSLGNGKYCYDTATFVLIGLHIIHKTKNAPYFVFSTFEQIDNGDTQGSNYYYKNTSTVDTLEPCQNVETASGFYQAKRVHPLTSVTDQVNFAAWSQIRAKDPNSVWLNYRLIGVQFIPVDVNNQNQYGDVQQDFYLANLVTESNCRFQNFTGSFPNASADNIILKPGGGKVNMGGCMGCHGVAQLAGADFSFIISGGRSGARPEAAND